MWNVGRVPAANAPAETSPPTPPTPKVVEVIAALAADGVKIAIMSDFHVDLRPHLDSLGVLDVMSGVTLSCEIGVAKPVPRMFRAALDMVAVPPQRCLMVGDNPRPETGETGETG